MKRFFSPQPLTETPLRLEGQIARHMIQVMRLRPGDEVELFDGQHRCVAQLLEADKRGVTLTLGAALPLKPASPLSVHLGQVISKGDRMDYAIQKATELGVTEITPLYSLHGDVRLKGERAEKKRQHWQQVALSACEQCGRDDLPVVHPAVPLEQWLSAVSASLRLVMHPGQSMTQWARADSPTSVAVLVGPEGGLADSEVEQAQAQLFQPVTVGPRILRTETAPVVMLTLLQSWWGDLADHE
ncbi:16S rRNA (uracil(1498)-N(3))-methyltransferase [Terasakiispira papahanaumokuakeensis]|uniref:Ribosomal RNA small subunit methyltransferase E n=1 Tax=Terasakiispira papahanaumokuakeensis TaxID=197479 RepID=A0A1E2VCH6_9GAMM|nr:16S rRNA (uracil(1498)-N(3))-methyltransferase [Terasakiispira papahanaumokuakeensis]ODC04728.1 16S rRNA (uracil(1498)-N(3))-methyltransferase [Terasakiispira papahanaumokuakeensis]